MNITKIITPKNDDGSLDQRFGLHIEKLIHLCGVECINTLHTFHKETEESERKAGGAALHMIVKLYSIEMQEWEQKRLAKSLREALQEIGFKPSKVTKLIGAGKFKAEEWNRIHIDDFEYKSNEQLKDEQHEFLSSYGATALYEISRMNDCGQFQVRNAFNNDKKLFRKDELEEIRRENPINLDEQRGRGSKNFGRSNNPSLPQVSSGGNSTQYKNLKSAEDVTESRQLSAQAVVNQFLHAVEPSSMDKLLKEYTPHAQDQILSLLAEGVKELSEYILGRGTISI